ncbi:hypothetical protein HDV00_002381, partial [Rhizophlyctis rosea]
LTFVELPPHHPVLPIDDHRLLYLNLRPPHATFYHRHQTGPADEDDPSRRRSGICTIMSDMRMRGCRVLMGVMEGEGEKDGGGRGVPQYAAYPTAPLGPDPRYAPQGRGEGGYGPRVRYVGPEREGVLGRQYEYRSVTGDLVKGGGETGR